MWYHWLVKVQYQHFLVLGVQELEFENAYWDVIFVATLAKEQKAEGLLESRKYSWVEVEVEFEVAVAARSALVAR